ncbi:MAG: iron-containing alcohol dehydrogenase [Firmicutes bacterium]|nr:iron-containing alcohol dehydrogenase [Bacillota bacterium]
MDNFEFLSPTKIIFGKGAEDQLVREVKKLGKKILLHYGEGSIKRIGLYDQVVKSLQEAGIDFIELGGVKPNPRLSLVYEGIKLCREHKVDGILAVGGGSAIDSAKAIGVGVPYDGDVWDFYCGKNLPEETLPVGVVLTLAATGSEASNSSVITKEDGWLKRGLNIDLIRPVFAIMNPEHTFTVSRYQTACGGADIMSHVFERYFTNTKNVELTDRLCEAVLKTVVNNLPVALAQPDNYDARAELLWAGTLAHNGLLSTGRGGNGDWAAHKIELELSGLYDVAHGAGLAAIFPAWMKYVYRHDLNRFVQLAVRVWNVEPDFANPERTALEGIDRLTKFFKECGLPTTLAEMNIPADRLEEMARKATRDGQMVIGQFVKLTTEDVVAIYKLAL